MNSNDWVRTLVMPRVDLAKSLGQTVTAERLREFVTEAVIAVQQQGMDTPSDLEQLIRDLEADINVVIADWNSLADDTDHVPWLAGKLDEKSSWKFWNRYARYMRGEQGLPAAPFNKLDEITDDILGRLEDPTREGPWDRRGLVAGQVQSGKTGNFTGLIAKALDNGYKLVVVLAGVHNSLRSQTQTRIDAGILGFDTRAIRQAAKANDSTKVGVGKLSGPRLFVNSFTSSADDGDFRLAVAQNMGVVPGGADPIVLVIKKNKSILENLYKWATLLTKERDPKSGKFKVPRIPVLVIDDEADYASINTKHPKAGEDEVDPSAINGLIRRFLDTFDRTAYVAYTATPFANIFIDPEGEHSEKGKDLFPGSFIVNLPPPSNYVGPERVFGLKEDTANAIEEVESLPIVRKVFDYDTWLPDKHRASDDVPSGDLPQSLKDSIILFLMAGGVRRWRGQVGKHHSMLVHVTRFTSVQKRVAGQIADFLGEVQQRFRYGEGGDPLLKAQVERLYESDLLPTSASLSNDPELSSLIGPLPPFDELWAYAAQIADVTKIHVVNGKSEDVLEYIDHPEGISVIAVGGDKLSRGLTLEGLCVSYYLRTSKMYDTLMQMGRWFGYRPGYLDVCRLYTTTGLIDWYERITAASAELQREFEAMAILDKTPADFGLRVRQHPDGLMVSSPAKLKHAQKISISFSGSIATTVTFRAVDRQTNFDTLNHLVGRLGAASDTPTGMRVWRNVSPEEVLGFLGTYQADRVAFKVQPQALADYILQRVADGELQSWTIVLADATSPDHWFPIGEHDIGLTRRTDQNSNSNSGRYTVKTVLSPGHELVDLVKGSPRWEKALADTRAAWEISPRRKPEDDPPVAPSGVAERRTRPESNGLLLLYPLDPHKWNGFDGEETPFAGFSMSFPESDRAKPTEYQVNAVRLKEWFGWDDEELEDD
ncbi:Putative endonuclease, Z1 domain containing protein [Mycobacteriaceae bacterium]